MLIYYDIYIYLLINVIIIVSKLYMIYIQHTRYNICISYINQA